MVQNEEGMIGLVLGSDYNVKFHQSRMDNATICRGHGHACRQTDRQTDRFDVCRMSVTLFAGDWSPWTEQEVRCGGNIRLRQDSLPLVDRHRRSNVGRRLLRWSHSTAEQHTTTGTRPLRRQCSREVAVAWKIRLQWAHIKALHSAQHPRVLWLAFGRKDLSIQPTISDRFKLASVSSELVTHLIRCSSLFIVDVHFLCCNILSPDVPISYTRSLSV